uniref:Uncharacterized protein n=1 Tax=Triticum urartu TaxID=4572 RepID=A0A8R7QYI9_TRIUA
GCCPLLPSRSSARAQGGYGDEAENKGWRSPVASEGEARPWRGGSGRGGGGGGREGAEGIEDDVRGADEGDIFIFVANSIAPKQGET